ncbi:MAG: hypothetical protein AAB305_02045 [Candidatus Zixiibacteriota bacterium]
MDERILSRVLRIAVALACLLAMTGFVGCNSSGGSNGTGGGGGGTVTVAVADATVLEGNVISFTVTRTGSTTDPIIFNYSEVAGTATIPSDLPNASGSDTVAAGATTTNVSLATTEDATPEFGESFTFKISSVTGASVTDSMATGKIWDDDGVSYASAVKPILASNCAVATCHGSGSSSGGYTMGTAAWATVRNAVGNNGAIVVPQDAGSSSLYFKTTGTPRFGVRMPKNGTPLTAEQQATIRDWIDQDAQDN